MYKLQSIIIMESRPLIPPLEQAQVRDYHHGCYSSVSYVDNKDEFRIELYAPGFHEGDFRLSFKDNVLCIYGCQRGTDTCFLRNIKIPGSIDVSSSCMDCKHGSFKVSFPKKYLSV